MKRYAILMALAVMLCGTEAGAATIGFDTMSSPFGDTGVEFENTGLNFQTAPGGTNNWSIAQTGGNNFASSTINSSFSVEVASSGLDGNGKPIYPEFTVQGFDVSSIGGTSVFLISGFPDRDDQNASLFTFTYSVQDGVGFERILLGVTSATLTTFNPFANNDPTDNSRTSFDVNIDKVQRVIISVSHDSNITSRTDCIDVGPGSNTCFAPGGGPTYNTPEPASLLLLGAGLAGIGIWRRKAGR